MTAPSSKLGQHNAKIFGSRLGLSPDGIVNLTQNGVI